MIQESHYNNDVPYPASHNIDFEELSLQCQCHLVTRLERERLDEHVTRADPPRVCVPCISDYTLVRDLQEVKGDDAVADAGSTPARGEAGKEGLGCRHAVQEYPCHAEGVEGLAGIPNIVHVGVLGHVDWVVDALVDEALRTVEGLSCFTLVQHHEVGKVRNEYH